MIWGVTLKPGEDYTEVMDNEVHLSMAALECRPRLAPGKDLAAHVIMKTAIGEYLLCTLGCYGPTPQQALDLILQPNEKITFSVEGSGVVYLTGYTAGYALSEYCDDQERGFEEENDLEQVQEVDMYPTVEEEEDEYLQEHQKDDSVSDNVQIIVKAETHPGRGREHGTDDPIIEGMVETVQENEFVDEANFAPVQKEKRISSEAELTAPSDINVTVAQVHEDGTEINTTECWDNSPVTYHTGTRSNQRFKKCCYCSELTTTEKTFYDGENFDSIVVKPCCQNCLPTLETSAVVADSAQTSGSHQPHLQEKPISCRTRKITSGSHQPHLQEKPISRRTRKCEIFGHMKGPVRQTSSSPRNSIQFRINRNGEKCNVSQISRARKFDTIGHSNQVYQSSSQDLNQETSKGISSGYIYKCTYCPKMFASVSGRKIHERMHTGEKPYKCEYCPRAFTQRTNWKSHERTHTGEKPYKCSYCEKTFIRTDAVKSHERTHTGEKPFKCKHCPRAFSQRAVWKKHEQTHQLT